MSDSFYSLKTTTLQGKPGATRMDGRAPLVPNTPEVRQYRARFKDNDLQ